MSAYHMT